MFANRGRRSLAASPGHARRSSPSRLLALSRRQAARRSDQHPVRRQQLHAWPLRPGAELQCRRRQQSPAIAWCTICCARHRPCTSGSRRRAGRADDRQHARRHAGGPTELPADANPVRAIHRGRSVQRCRRRLPAIHQGSRAELQRVADRGQQCDADRLCQQYRQRGRRSAADRQFEIQPGRPAGPKLPAAAHRRSPSTARQCRPAATRPASNPA